MQLVFDVTQTSFTWDSFLWMSAVWFLVLAIWIGALAIDRQQDGYRKRLGLHRWFVAMWFIAFTWLVFGGVLKRHQCIQVDLAEVEDVEGVVERARYDLRHDRTIFSIGGRQFSSSHSNLERECGYSQSAGDAVRFRDGMRVRLNVYDGKILRVWG